MEVGKLQWSCHFCYRIRDDADISVAAKPNVWEVEGLMPIQVKETRRYCNDSEECWRNAMAWKRGAA